MSHVMMIKNVKKLDDKIMIHDFSDTWGTHLSLNKKKKKVDVAC